MKILFKNARILTMKDEDIIFSNLIVEDNKIKYIGADIDVFSPFDRTIDCEGNLLMPGFKNCHGHCAMTFLRSKFDDMPLQDWLFNHVFPVESHLDDDLSVITDLTKLGFLEYLSSGITTSLENYFGNPFGEKAAKDFGFRMYLAGAYHFKDRDYSFLDKQHFDHINDPIAKYVIALHSVYLPEEDEFQCINDLIKKYKEPLYLHNSETYDEVINCKNKFNNMTPTEYLDSRGFFDYGGGCYHCCYLSDHDFEIFKNKDISFITCPGSNMKLASGIANVKKALDMGINVAIGTDGPTSNNNLDMFKEMQLTAGLQRLLYKDPAIIKAFDILKMATVNGAKALRNNDIDVLEEGKLADIIMIDLSRPNMQPITNIISNLVYAGSKDDVKMTMIDGKILYYNHEFFVGEDVNELYARCQKISETLWKKANL